MTKLVHSASPILSRPTLARPRSGPLRILVLKLDHFGDFLIGQPAMAALRATFPDARIRLICGAWNLAAARVSGFADEVRAYNFFPENGMEWTGQPSEDLALFDAASEGAFDIAIDLRVDGDTRALLKRVDAAIKCGVGSNEKFDFLDVVLPVVPRALATDPDRLNKQAYSVERFSSRMRSQGPLVHETDARRINRHVIYGPYAHLPRGRFEARFGLRTLGGYGWPATRIKIEVARDNVVVAAARVSPKALSRGPEHPPTLGFVVPDTITDDSIAEYEFRVHVSGWSWGGRLQFSGVQLEQVGVLPSARYRVPELHIGEQLSLLVELVKQRLLFEAMNDAPPGVVEPPVAVAALLARSPEAPRIMIAPLSNSSLRDWPFESYARLVTLLLEKTRAQIVLVGAPSQTATLAALAAQDGERVVNLAGQTAWGELPGVLKRADLVICNNSGVAHLAAELGVPTLAIYSASHQPQEWGPRGPRARTLMAEVACSPCGHDRIEHCPVDHLCMRLITPERVLSEATAMLDNRAVASTAI